VDDCLCIHHAEEKVLRELGIYFKMKAGLIEDSGVYLRVKPRKMKFDNGVE
jgi:hypothetical protein